MTTIKTGHWIKRLITQILKIKTVEGLKIPGPSRSTDKFISEVSPIIRFLIPEEAFEVDFLIPLSPNMKKDFILVMAMRPV